MSPLRHRHHEETRLFGLEQHRWENCSKLPTTNSNSSSCTKADIEHSTRAGAPVERFAKKLHMEDAVVAACEKNLQVWELYLNGIGAARQAGCALMRATG